jgi:tyrosinase
MRNLHSQRFTSFLLIVVVWTSGCAVIPRCPTTFLPILETQVNNSYGNEDDYLSTTAFVPCSVRITNFSKYPSGFNFPGGVEVEIRNIVPGSGLLFSTTNSGAGSAAIFVTVPQDGALLNFFVKGTSTSTIDKSAIIEIATAGASCNETVLTRIAAMVPAGAAPITVSAATPRVVIDIASVSHLDDYIAWAPVFGRIKWANPTSTTATLNVRLQNMPTTDRLRFAANPIANGTTATNPSLNLTLNGDGTWINFFVAGNFGNASLKDKDAVMEVIDSTSNALLSREAMMVRIRKNANNLTAPERDRYLEALRKVNLTYGSYIEFVRTHARDNTGSGGSAISWRQAHRGSGFLPWHRAFVLHLERLLQSADPSVAIHYWKFDDNAPNIFAQNFMGSNNTTASVMVNLAASNPIVSWTLAGESTPTGIQRETPYGDGGHPFLATEAGTLALGGTIAATSSFGDHLDGMTNVPGFKNMEPNPHDPAHAGSGQISWIGPDPALAVRDPLFFFLHGNVDRLWAKWQWMRERYAPTDIKSYDLQGSHATPAAGVPAPVWTVNGQGQLTANRTLGHYADDTMWPWDNVLSTYSTEAQTLTVMNSTSGRPNNSVLNPLPIVLGAILPGTTPKVMNMIDYIGKSAQGTGAGFGFGYDDFFPY